MSQTYYQYTGYVPHSHISLRFVKFFFAILLFVQSSQAGINLLTNLSHQPDDNLCLQIVLVYRIPVTKKMTYSIYMYQGIIVCHRVPGIQQLDWLAEVGGMVIDQVLAVSFYAP